MYASIRASQLRPESQGVSSAAREEFTAIRGRQPGSRGGLTIDAGDGRLVTVALWDSEEAANAAAPTVRAAMERLLLPDLAAPPELIYTGNVVSEDISGR